jgi:hypothetical protein
MPASVVALYNAAGLTSPALSLKGVKRWALKAKDDGEEVAAGTAAGATAGATTGDAIGIAAGATAGAAKLKRY